MLSRPPLPFIFIGQRCQYVETILVRAARFRVPERADFIDRCTMVIIVPDRSDLHSPVLQISPTTSSKARSTRSEEHTSELQSLMRISYAVFCLKKKTQQQQLHTD